MHGGPLSGTRIIEMEAIGPVPLAGMILAGLGAEIVRIKRPSGNTAWDDLGESVLLRGRTEIELDLKSKTGKSDFLKLVERADGLMEGARPGVMEKLGVGPGICLERNPRIVIGRMTGWGQDGPLSKTAGHDINYIAITGALHAIGAKGQPPTVPLNLVGDYAGGTMFLALGMVSAILNAKTTGLGQVVDAAMVDGVANLLALFHAYLGSGNWIDEPESNLLDGLAPFYRCYQCSCGGSVAVGALEPQFFALLLDGLEIPRDRFAQGDRTRWPEMQAEFERIFMSKPRQHWETRFSGSDACVSPVLSMREAFEHPANKHRHVFQEHQGIMQAAPAPRFSQTPATITKSKTTCVEAVLKDWGSGG